MKRHQHSRTRHQGHLCVERLDARQVMSATAVNFEVPEMSGVAIISDDGAVSNDRAPREFSVPAAKSLHFEATADLPAGPFQDALRLNHSVTEIIKARSYPLEPREDSTAGVRALEALLQQPFVESRDDTALLFNQSLNFDVLADREEFTFSPIILWRQVFSGGMASFGEFTIEASAAPQEIEMLEGPRERIQSGSIIELATDGETDPTLPSNSHQGSTANTLPLPRSENGGISPAMRFENAVDRILMRSSLRNDSRPSEDGEGGLLTIDPLDEPGADVLPSTATDRKKVTINLQEMESIWTALVETMFPSSPQQANRGEHLPDQNVLPHHVALFDDAEGGMVELDSMGPLQADTPTRPPQMRIADRDSNLETGVAFFTEFDLSTSPATLGEPRDNTPSRRPKNPRNAAAEVPMIETDLHSAALVAPLFFVGMVFATTTEERELPRPEIARPHPFTK